MFLLFQFLIGCFTRRADHFLVFLLVGGQSMVICAVGRTRCLVLSLICYCASSECDLLVYTIFRNTKSQTLFRWNCLVKFKLSPALEIGKAAFSSFTHATLGTAFLSYGNVKYSISRLGCAVNIFLLLVQN